MTARDVRITRQLDGMLLGFILSVQPKAKCYKLLDEFVRGDAAKRRTISARLRRRRPSLFLPHSAEKLSDLTTTMLNEHAFRSRVQSELRMLL